MNAMRLIIAFLSLVLAAAAQPPEGPRPPSGSKPPKPAGEPYRRGPGGQNGPHDGMMRPPPGFEKLNDQDRQLMRDAFAKAWNDPEVLAVREEAMKANEKVRRALHEKMSHQDPRVAAILEKMKPPYPVDERGLPVVPPPESPDFTRLAVARLGAETMSIARPGRHEETRRFHERLMQLPRIQEAVGQMERAAPQERTERFRRLKEIYRQTAAEEWQRQRPERGDRPERDGRESAPDRKKQ